MINVIVIFVKIVIAMSVTAATLEDVKELDVDERLISKTAILLEAPYACSPGFCLSWAIIL